MPMSSRFPSPAADYLEQRLAISTVLLQNPQSTELLTCTSDELIDEHIPVGAILVVNKAINPQHGHIVLAIVDGELRIRRFRKIVNHVTLCAANQQTYYATIKMDESMTIWGVVTGVYIKTM